MSTLIADVRHALRSLSKNRGFAAVALLTVALGVGANTAVFSVVNAVLLQPLPYAESDRLVAIRETSRRATIEQRAVSYPNFLDWQREARGAQAMAANSSTRFTLLLGNTPERVIGEAVSWAYFDVLGIVPIAGRGLEASDDGQGRAPVVVISERLWERAFKRDRAAVGRAVRVDEELATIVGIMPASFTGLNDSAEIWAPIGRFTDAETLTDRGDRWISSVIARLRPGVTAEQFGAEMDALAARLEEAYPDDNGSRGAVTMPLRDRFFGPMRPMLLILLGAVGFVLLIACVNVANLLLARGSARQRELAVRTALGAQRARIIRQLLTESVTLSVLGGAAGLIAAFWSIDLLVAFSPVPFPTFVRVGVDNAVLAFTFAICVLSGLLFGVVPAVAASRTDIVTTLKMGGREADASGSTLLRKALVTAEIALALVLLVGAGLMIRTLDRIQAFDPGFNPAGLITLRVAQPVEAGTDPEARAEDFSQFARALAEKLRRLPAMTDAALASDVPLGTSSSATMVRVDGRDLDQVRVYRHAVSPGYFRTLEVRIVEGRDFSETDARSADQRVTIVSRTMARRSWPDRSAVGQRLRVGDRTCEVIGVVNDVQQRDLLQTDADPDVYFPLFQLPTSTFSVLARTSGDLEPAVAAIRRTVTELNGAVPVFAVESGDELLAEQTSRERFSTVLLAAFALVALTLTMVGIYGVTAYSVSRQTRQVGIRMALGATRGDVLRLVLRGGLSFILAGLALGALAAIGLTRLLSSLIYGISATDPVTFATVAALLGLTALAACFIPAARATRIDPVVALRAE
jgi:predicted permease